MKKYFLLLTVSLISATNLFSQNSWLQIHPLPSSYNYSDTYFVNEQKGWVVGQYGMIWCTEDGGNSWVKQFSDSNKQFNSVFFIDENEGWTVGWGDIYHTTDAGQNWIRQPRPQVQGDLQDVYFISPDTGWIVGMYESILKTTDGGDNWIRISSSVWNDIDYFAVYFTDALNGCVVGGETMGFNKAVTKVTVDGGETWTDTSPVDANNLYSLYFISQDTGFASGNGAEILKTTDGGNSWEIKNNEYHSGFLNSIYFFDDSTGIALSGNHNYFTYDSGESWEFVYQDIEGSIYLKGFCGYNDSSGIAVGTEGRVIKTTNRGQDWQRIDDNIAHAFYGIGFFDANNGIAILEPNAEDKIMMTDDGGYSWFEKEIEVGFYFYDMSLPSQNVGYLLPVDGSKFAKTTNGGDEWTLLDLPEIPYGYYNAIQFLDEQTGYVSGFFGHLFKTKDGGISWTESLIPDLPHLKGMVFINENLGWLIDGNGQVIKTETGGESFSYYLLEGDDSTYTPTSISFVNELSGYISTEEGPVFKTENGGESWEIVYSFFEDSYSKIYFLDEDRGWFKSKYRIYSTEDGGESWESQVNNLGLPLFEIFFLDNETGWYCGVSGTVGEYVTTVSVDKIEEERITVKAFPNPAYDQLSLSLCDFNAETIQLRIVDLNGREIQSLSLKNKTDNVQLDVSKLNPGLYIVTIEAESKRYFSRFIKY